MLNLSAFSVLETTLPDGSVVCFRQARGNGVGTVVLLHGIGSNSGSWAAQLQHGLNAGRVLAWDAPGYGNTNAVGGLSALRPTAQDYAAKLWQWLDALGVTEVHLVGHSLGCIMAARAAAMQPQRVTQLTLLSVAQGYATAPTLEREAKRAQRLDALNTLGPQGMADKRSSAMLSDNATTQQRDAVRELIAQVNPAGYTQAVHLLMDADIASDLQFLSQASLLQQRTRIACGTADSITPPVGCAALAARFNIPYTAIAGAGHAIAIEAPDAVNDFLSI